MVSARDDGVNTDALDAGFERLRDEVQTIQIRLAERSKPWYKQHSVLISGAAVLITLAFNSFGVVNQYRTSAKDGVAKSVEHLQTTLSQLTQIRTDDAMDSAASAKNDFAGYSNRNTIRNVRRVALLESASAELSIAEGRVPSATYIALGTEMIADGQYKKGDDTLALGVAAAPRETTDRVWALYSRAQVRLMPDSPLYAPDEGRNYYRQALAERLSDNDNTRYQRGQLYGRIAQLEKLSGHPAPAEVFFHQAETEAAKMNLLNPLRQTLVQVIGMYRQAVTPASTTRGIAFTDASTWLGEWRIAGWEGEERRGNVTFLIAGPANMTAAYVDIFQEEKLVERMVGQVSVFDNKKLRVDWNGQRYLPAPMATAGYSIVRARQGGRTMSIDQYAFGSDAAHYRIAR